MQSKQQVCVMPTVERGPRQRWRTWDTTEVVSAENAREFIRDVRRILQGKPAIEKREEDEVMMRGGRSGR